MEAIFRIATEISTPLALSGFFAASFFFLAKQIIAKNIFPKLTKKNSSELLKFIVNKIFILSLIAMLLGFLGHIVSFVKASPRYDVGQIDNDAQKPHLIYSWDSNYSLSYLGGLDPNMSKTTSRITITNVGSTVLSNIRINIYLFELGNTRDDERYFSRIYNLNNKSYLNISQIVRPALDSQKSITFDLMEEFVTSPKIKHISQDNIRNLLMPNFGQKIAITIANPIRTNDPAIQQFSSEAELLEIECPYFKGYNGLKLDGTAGIRAKILISYEINNKEFVHLLHGGIYYYVHHVDGGYFPCPAIVDGIQKAQISKWRYVGEAEFRRFEMPQSVISIQDENIFQSNYIYKYTFKPKIQNRTPFDMNIIIRNDIGKLIYERGIDCYNNKEYGNALIYLTRAINLGIVNASIFEQRGWTYYCLDDRTNCCNDFARACNLGNCKIYEKMKKSNICF